MTLLSWLVVGVATVVVLALLGYAARARRRIEREQAALREGEERYRTFLEQTAEGVWRFELDGPLDVSLPEDDQINYFYAHAYLAECNNAVAQMYGFDRASDLVGCRLAEFLPRSDPHNTEYLRAFVRSGYRLQDAVSHEQDRTGAPRYFLNNLLGIVEAGQLWRAWGTQRDITEHKQATEALAASEARFRRVLESDMIGIAFWDGQQVTDANDELLRVLGYERADVQAGRLRHGRLTPPEYEAADRRATDEVIARGACTPYEKEFLRKDGSRVPVLVGGALLDGDRRRGVFFVLDLTERRRTEEQLHAAQRLETVGRLAGGVAHEANNQMSVVLGTAHFVLRHPELPAQVRHDIEQIRTAAERTAAITRQLLAFSRQQVLRPQALDLNAEIRNLEPMLRRTLGAHTELVLRLAPELGPVRVDPVQLSQVILNLTLNARDAMPSGGVLTIESADTVLDDENAGAAALDPVPPGPYAVLTVTDTGHGMDHQVIGCIFEPFFTTKPVGEGTGLGLSTVHGIVRQSGGHITVDSAPGRGATFKVYLPRTSSGPAPAAVTVSPPAPRMSGTVLLVEDEPNVRGVLARALQQEGYTVFEASTGREALTIATGNHERFDLVVTDIVMPEMGGAELAAELARSRPEVPVLFTSGLSDDEMRRRGLIGSMRSFLQKPYSPEAFAARVREVVASLSRPGL